MGLRPRVKAFAEIVLVRGGLSRVGRFWHRKDTLLLGYHNILPDGCDPVGEHALHLPQREFALQLDQLSRSHDVVPLDCVLSEGPPGGRPRAVITFDDAYHGAITAGLAETVKRGLSATVFVAPAFIGGGSFWWDALADPRTGVLSAEVRQYALRRLQGRDDLVRAWGVDSGLPCQELPRHARVASEEELRHASQLPGVSIGTHTWSHPNLTSLDRAAVEGELRQALTWIQERFATAVPWIAYPYGLASPAVHAVAAGLHRGGVMIGGGWASGHDHPLGMPRVNVPAGVSTAGFVLRAAGILS